MPQKIESPNEAEFRWLDECLSRLREFSKKEPTYRFPVEELDAIYSAWISERKGEEDPNPMINSFGAAFGQQFVDRLGMAWSVVTDEYGTEMAVCGQPGDVLVFPMNFVGKRYVSKEVGFIASAFAAMSKDVEHLREQAKPKPWWKKW